LTAAKGAHDLCAPLVRFRVLFDGRPLGPAHGLDEVVRKPAGFRNRTCEITFLDAGVSLTFLPSARQELE
jgi:hypothetical protein